MGLVMVMQHAVEAALRADEKAPIGKDRHDLGRRQRRELGFVTGKQDPLALLVSEAVKHPAVAAFTAIQAVPITRELPTPALQGSEPNAQQRCHLSGPCTGRLGGIEDFQGLAAILRCCQSPSSLPQ